MRRKAVGPMADPDPGEHNKSRCVDTAGRGQAPAVMEGLFFENLLFTRAFLTLSAQSSCSNRTLLLL